MNVTMAVNVLADGQIEYYRSCLFALFAMLKAEVIPEIKVIDRML